MKELFLLLLMPCFTSHLKAQPANCVLKSPAITIHFGTGNVRDVNTEVPANYQREQGYCPNDGYYSYSPYTSDCFKGDWFTLTEDHTPGDLSGNMMLVNASDNSGSFLNTTINGLKGGARYEFAVWLMNLCRISDQCLFPLLPNITIRLQTKTGETLALFNTGNILRPEKPQWIRHSAFFIMPPSESFLRLTMVDNSPGGCGNDFALDDITFREYVKRIPVVNPPAKATAVIKRKPQPPPLKPRPKKATPVIVKSQQPIEQTISRQKDLKEPSTPVLKPIPLEFPSPPAVLTTRSNTVVKQIETEAGEIIINLYDNGEIDGDTVSIYHNNVLLVSNARLSEKPIVIRIAVDEGHPHHELIMVAENLGSIPPNTSMMIITAGDKRYEVFISSTEQKNAKVIVDLKNELTSLGGFKKFFSYYPSTEQKCTLLFLQARGKR